MVAEEERVLAILRDAKLELNVGQIQDVEAFDHAVREGLVERSYAGVNMIFQMLALPKVVLCDKAFDWLEEKGLDL